MLTKNIFIFFVFLLIFISPLLSTSFVNAQTSYYQLFQKLTELESAGKYKEAVSYAEELLKIREEDVEKKKKFGFFDFTLIDTIYKVAKINHKAGNIERAEGLYKRAIELGQYPLAKYSTITSIEGLVDLYIETSRKNEAEKLYMQILQSDKEMLDRDPLYNIKINTSIGDYYLKDKEYKESEKYYSHALNKLKESYEQSEKTGSGFTEAMSGLSALSSIVKSIQKSQTDKAQNTSYIGEKIINNLAFVYYKLEKYEKLKSLYENDFKRYFKEKLVIKENPLGATIGNIPINELGITNPLLVTVTNNFATLFASSGSHKDAHNLFMETMEMNGKIMESLFSNIFFDEMKLRYFINSRIYPYIFLSHTAQYMQIEARDTFNCWVKFKGSLMEFQSKLIDIAMKSENRGIKEKFEEYKKAHNQVSKLSLSGQDIATQEYLNLKMKRLALEIELGRLVKPYLEKLFDKVNTDTISATLSKNSVYLDFAKIATYDFKEQKFGDDRYYAFVLIPDEKPTIKLIDVADAKDVDSLVHKYQEEIRFSLVTNQIPEEKTLKQIGSKLFEKVIMPLEPYLKNKKEILISPDGNLNLIPFEVFVTPEGKYLIEDYNVNYITTGKDILKFNDNAKSKMTAVVIADPDYDMGTEEKEKITKNLGIQLAMLRGNTSRDIRNLHFHRLSDTKEEAQNIEKALKEKVELPVKTFLDKEALEDILFNIESPRILHIATHGFFLKPEKVELKTDTFMVDEKLDKGFIAIENPMLRSGIVLAGANTSIKSGKDDGIVSAEKLVGLNLKGTDLVVLSACNTGVGDIEAGEGVFGLERAFILSGAKTLVVSLWSVPSRETTEIMSNFYKLIAAGKTKQDALKDAKLEMLKKKSNPFYWGAFVMIGKPN